MTSCGLQPPMPAGGRPGGAGPLARLLGLGVEAGGVAPEVAQVGEHRLQDARVQGRSRRVVQIYAFSHRSQRSTGLLSGQGEISAGDRLKRAPPALPEGGPRAIIQPKWRFIQSNVCK